MVLETVVVLGILLAALLILSPQDVRPTEDTFSTFFLFWVSFFLLPFTVSIALLSPSPQVQVYGLTVLTVFTLLVIVVLTTVRMSK